MSESRQNPAMPLAIVGMGCLFAKAPHLGAYWANIKGGVDAITEIPETHWRPGDYYDADPSRPDFTYGKRGSFLSPIDFDPLAYGIPPNALEATDTSQLLGMVVARQGAVTLDWLKRHNIEYDEIHFGKPHAQVYIDDNAVRFESWDSIAGDGSTLPTSAEQQKAGQQESQNR